MRFTFPYFTPTPEFVQPDYDKWAAIRVGMSREEVVAVLGPPLDDSYRGGKARREDSYYSYGYLQLPMMPHPRTYSFKVGFDFNGRVFTRIDPFNGRLSLDGSPTTPEIILPLEGSVFSHYPRILDCRWFPSSGVYPMSYLVELGVGGSSRDEEFFEELIDSALPIPFLITSFLGAQHGRFRVKARNELGESAWSDFRGFEFTV